MVVGRRGWVCGWGKEIKVRGGRVWGGKVGGGGVVNMGAWEWEGVREDGREEGRLWVG